jgi:hypothetical protein
VSALDRPRRTAPAWLTSETLQNNVMIAVAARHHQRLRYHHPQRRPGEERLDLAVVDRDLAGARLDSDPGSGVVEIQMRCLAAFALIQCVPTASAYPPKPTGSQTRRGAAEEAAGRRAELHRRPAQVRRAGAAPRLSASNRWKARGGGWPFALSGHRDGDGVAGEVGHLELQHLAAFQRSPPVRAWRQSLPCSLWRSR